MRVTRIEAVLLGALALSCGDDDENADASANTGAMTCETRRPAVAYRARVGADSGEAASSTTPAPTPCSQLTGFASAETSLAVLKDGTVLVAPVITAEGTGIARRKGDGWEVLLPGKLGGAQHQRVQPYMYVDPTTQRVLFASVVGAGKDGFLLSLSDDKGSSWRATTVGAGTADWIKMASGAPANSAYASTLYASAPAPISTAFADHQQVQRSADGGETWTRVDNDQLPLTSAENGCEDGEWVIYGSGVVAADGSLYLGFRRCTRLGIAITRDQGASWTVRDLPGAALVPYGGLLSHQSLPNLIPAEPLAVDSAGNLYAAWNDDKDVLKLAVSRDRGETWSTPSSIAPPGVTHTVFADIDVKSPGTIALAYYGSDDGGNTYNAYVSETLDALSPTPSFYGARLNSPGAEPLFGQGFDIGYSEILSMGDLVEMVRVAYAPNGDIWASFSKDMCPGMDRSHCSWDPAAHDNATFQLVMGRLEH